MENRRPSRRPGSGRPSSRFNPITGADYEEDTQEKLQHNQVQHNQQQNEQIPSLNLGRLEDRERRVPISRGDNNESHRDEYYKMDPPSPTSTISWGTPSGTARSDLYTDRYQPVNHYEEGTSQRREEITPVPHDDDVIDKTWTSAPYHERQYEKITDAIDLEERKRRDKLLETVMVDQLSRAAISDPNQDSGRSLTDADHLYHVPGQARGAIRRLHHSKVKTSGSSTEQLLSQRVRFGARILTRVGSDAIRELTGFFFFAENSLTIYEYKQFGKTSKALPIINRGTYNHMRGRRRGMPYTLADIRPGNTLHFPVGGQKYLPDTARQSESVDIRICDVDEEAKANIVLAGVKPSDEAHVWNDFHMLTNEEYQDQAIINTIQDRIQLMIKKRGVKTLTGLSAHFRRCDRTGDGMLDRYELATALKDYHIILTSEEFDRMWTVVDQNGDGVLDYGEFIRSFIGTMSEFRKQFVRKAFQKIDPMHRGIISSDLMRKFFNAAKHPWVRSGEMSEIGLTEQFLASWSHCATKGDISYPEFEDYYEGLSVGIDDDNEFVNILRNCWGL